MSSDLKRGLESSKGDPRVVAALNVLLSVLFAYIVLWLTDLVGIVAFSLERLVIFALALVILTFLVTWQ